ncbi:hypothetical protein HMPREF3038_03050 [Akkermansia sp. KLE1797]|nr:hypothetical protein HMPREF3038_03050 [Akkermansia sp. KLE1797]KXU53790.1 hypothetical protein HMPREF3039_02034 [Akkermansia sp. KLE1798]KZA03957.1 hypothetical protein HMPREF1326_02372 [Akkermansia sp. KLE1605]
MRPRRLSEAVAGSCTLKARNTSETVSPWPGCQDANWILAT